VANNTCSAKHCDRDVRCKSLCNLHYIRFLKYGDPLEDMPVSGSGSKKTALVCSVADCGRPFKGRGLCNMHLIRLRRKGTINAEVPGQIYVKICQADSCNKKPHASGFCSKHLRRYNLYGDPNYKVTYPKVCQNEACQRKVLAKGLCSHHYRVQKYQENPAVGVLKTERRRARKNKVAKIEYGAEQITWRFSMFGNCCWICGSTDNLTIDHVKPLSANGPDMPANLRPACRSCNSRKRDKWLGPKNLKLIIA
jgi:5-methylcytosine-specific restriction endonuclease McrA